MVRPERRHPGHETTHSAGLWIGLSLFAAGMLLQPGGAGADKAWSTAAVVALMAAWWVTEAVPVALTGAMPFLLFPILGIGTPASIAAAYMSPAIFLVIGGSMLGIALEHWGIHRRIAVVVVSHVKPRPELLLVSLMGVTAAMSMLVTNTATAVMMLPIALAISSAVVAGQASADSPDQSARFTAAMLLAVTIGAHIGGFGTPIGTPINLIAISAVERLLNVRISFVEWMAFGVPIVLLTVPMASVVLSRITLRFRLEAVSRGEILAALGTVAPLSKPQRRVILVVLVTATAWISLPLLQGFLPGLSDAAIAVVAALVLCVVPGGTADDGSHRRSLLEWEQLKAAPWHLVFLLGGGLALAEGIAESGLTEMLSGQLHQVAGMNFLLLVVLLACFCSFLTEFAGNQGMAATFVPLAASIGGQGPEQAVTLAVVAGIASGWGYANPAGTPSNALVHGTGRVSARDMIRSGVLVDALGAVVVALVCAAVIPRLMLG